VPQGHFELALPHASSRSPLRAWDAADEHILRELAERLTGAQPPLCSAWIFEDRCGALSIPLLSAHPELRVTLYADALATETWVRANIDRLAGQGYSSAELASLHKRLSVTTLPDAERERAEGGAALVSPQVALIKVGPQLSSLKRALDWLTLSPPQLWTLGGGMCKHVHTSTIKAFEQRLGPSPTSLAWKKSRLIKPEGRAPQLNPAVLATQARRYRVELGELCASSLPAELSSLELFNLPGAFSEGQLDLGARAMVPHLSTALDEALEARGGCGSAVEEGAALQVADLGCGDGVLSWALLALAAARGVPIALTCLDLSAVALESAALSYQRWLERLGEPWRQRLESRVRFLGGDALDPWRALAPREPERFDLIINNPPFHERGATVQSISQRMFREAAEALSPGGALWVVGNRHLGYHQRLRHLFSSVQVRSDDPKFVIISAQSTRGDRALDPDKQPPRRRSKPPAHLKQRRLR